MVVNTNKFTRTKLKTARAAIKTSKSLLMEKLNKINSLKL